MKNKPASRVKLEGRLPVYPLWLLLLLAAYFAIFLTACSQPVESPPAETPSPSPESVESPTAADTPVPQAETSGVQGQVFIGPGCAGPVRIDQPCSDTPYQATLALLDPDGAVLLRFRTSTDGKFQIVLPPGKYILHPELETAFPTAEDVNFEVVPGQFTMVLVPFDSGMR